MTYSFRHSQSDMITHGLNRNAVVEEYLGHDGQNFEIRPTGNGLAFFIGRDWNFSEFTATYGQNEEEVYAKTFKYAVNDSDFVIEQE